MQKKALMIGWREWVALPELKVRRIKAKIDTGARTSALHALDIERFRKRGAEWVRFDIHPEQRSAKQTIHAEAKLLDVRSIRSSNGKSEDRPIIETELILHGTAMPIELSLSGRGAMGFRMLLGRAALRNRFLIDPSHSYLSTKPSKPR